MQGGAIEKFVSLGSNLIQPLRGKLDTTATVQVPLLGTPQVAAGKTDTIVRALVIKHKWEASFGNVGV